MFPNPVLVSSFESSYTNPGSNPIFHITPISQLPHPHPISSLNSLTTPNSLHTLYSQAPLLSLSSSKNSRQPATLSSSILPSPRQTHPITFLTHHPKTSQNFSP